MRFWSGIAVVLLALLGIGEASSARAAEPAPATLIAPPFVRQWTTLVGDQAYVIDVQDGKIYYGGHDGVGALDLATGKPMWGALAGKDVDAAVLQGQILYAAVREKDDAVLYALDTAGGAPRTIATLETGTFELESDPTHLYVLTRGNCQLRAYDPATARLLWSISLASGASGTTRLTQMVLLDGYLYVSLDEYGDFGVDADKGTILWAHPGKDHGAYPPIVIGSDIVTLDEGARRIRIQSGATVWTAAEGDGSATLVGNVLITNGHKGLVAYDVRDGHILWRHALLDAGWGYTGGSNTPQGIADSGVAWFLRRPALAITKEGKEIWRRSSPFTGSPIYADRTRLITISGRTGIMSYASGTLPPLPRTAADRRALAARLAGEFELLDDAERAQVEALGADACLPLLARYTEWAKLNETEPFEAPQHLIRYMLYTDVAVILGKIALKEHTGAILAALKTLKSGSLGRSLLERLLQDRGDQALYIPTLVANMRRSPLQQDDRAAALSAVAHSSQPQAVALMQEALRDPKAPWNWRQEAFRHLAGTGGAAGVQAVRAARPGRRRQQPWYERIMIPPSDPERIVARKTDTKGRTWLLFHSSILGNGSDLFLAQMLGPNSWGKPLFTGVWTERTFHYPAPAAFHDVSMATVLAGEWIDLFPDDPTLRKDTDGDGLTDLVEARLGTDPKRGDTDSDGVPDAVDPCPNAPRRPLGDAEKILSACMDARFFEEGWATPAVIDVDGVAPFELYGYAGSVLWATGKKDSALKHVYGGGVQFIGLYDPDRDTRGPRHRIRFSPDHKTARTMISRYSGGLNGDGYEATLKKIGDDWFVVDLVLRYQS